MIKVTCNICNEELEQTGGLCFTPPGTSGNVVKYHVCRGCWTKHVAPLIYDDTDDCTDCGCHCDKMRDPDTKCCVCRSRAEDKEWEEGRSS